MQASEAYSSTYPSWNSSEWTDESTSIYATVSDDDASTSSYGSSGSGVGSGAHEGEPSASPAGGSSPRTDSWFDGDMFTAPAPTKTEAEVEAEGLATRATKAPLALASFVSRMMYSWATGLMRLGAQRPLEAEDLWATAPEDLGRVCVDSYYQHRAARPDEHVRTSFVRTFLPHLSPLPLLIVVWVAAVIGASIFLLRAVIQFLDSDDPLWIGVVMAFGMLVLVSLRSVTIHYIFFTSVSTGMRAKSALALLVYDKVLRAGSGNTSVGGVVSLVSADAFSVLMAFTFGVWLVAGPLILALALIFLIVQVGPAAIPGFALMLAIMPLQILVGKRIGEYRHAALKVTDARTRLMSEILSSIKIIKLYAWESSFAEAVARVRADEKAYLRKSTLAKMFNLALSFTFPVLVAFVVFAIYTARGNTLTPSTVFVVLSIVNVCRFPLIMLPLAIKHVTEAWVAFARLAKYLESDDLPSRITHPSDTPEVTIDGGSFAWDPSPESDSPITLQDVVFQAKGNEKIAIVGRVGAGKTSLLSAILADIPEVMSGGSSGGSVANANGSNNKDTSKHQAKSKSKGKGKGKGKSKSKGASSVTVEGTLAYVSQAPWVPNASLQDNILFGLAYDDALYKAVIRATALQPDIDMLPAGDQTEIGERGINLSGGQKQRVALARALYARRNIYLLDDPLSAVDAHVGSLLFHDYVMGALRDKLVIMVTHQVQYLGSFDKVYEVVGRTLVLRDHSHVSPVARRASDPDEQAADVDTGANADTVADADGAKGGDSGKLIVDEDRARGHVSWNVLRAYAEAAGSSRVIAYIGALFAIVQGARVAADAWLSMWISQDGGETDDLEYHLGVYAFIVVFLIVSFVGRDFVWTHFTLKAASTLHNETFARVLRAPMAFFDTNTLGRVLNRFTKDMGILDDELPFSMHQSLLWGTYTVFAALLITIVLPFFAPFLLGFGWVFYMLQMFYRKSSRELKRLENNARSPLFSHVSTTLAGIATVRAYAAEARFGASHALNVDGHQRALYASLMAQRWVGFRFDTMATATSFLAVLFAVLSRSWVSASFLALAIVYANTLSGLMQWFARVTAEAEANMTSVERLVHYGSAIKVEAPAVIKETAPAADWPAEGAIEFQNAELRYREDLPLVLKGVSVNIAGGETVGLVGRTGSGKSTTITSLFRLVELCGGSIVIDGVDIATIGLDQLRSKLAIIPQDPVLFQGTVRRNLDPFDEYTDDAVWDALRRSHIIEAIRENPAGLSAPVETDGANFSMGQRQLLCLGRALLRSSSILILDEATSSADPLTDKLIQTTVAEELTDCTVLVVAHRLDTVVDADKVMVMDNGRVIEYGPPHTLLDDPDSAFTWLVQQTGGENAARLRERAHERHAQRGAQRGAQAKKRVTKRTKRRRK